MEAENEAAVENRLRQQQLNPVKVKKKPPRSASSFGSRRRRQGARHVHAPVRHDDRRRPARSCSASTSSRNQQAEQDLPGGLKRHQGARRSRAPPSATRSAATRRSSTSSSSNLVQAGEVGGILDTHPEPPRDLHREARQAHPPGARRARSTRRIVSVIAIGVMAVLLTFVIPAFENMFKEFGAKDELPKLTQVGRRVLARLRHLLAADRPRASSAARRRDSSTRTERPPGKRFVHRIMLQLPSSGRCSGRSRSRASPARSARCSSRASPSSTRSTSSPRRPATSIVEEGIMYARAAHQRRQEHGRAAHRDRRCSRRWSCR